MNSIRNIETNEFEFEFLSKLGERESWRKEIHRPIYHIHKWWAKRLGSVFRGIVLGAALPKDSSVSKSFYSNPSFEGMSLFDPFMGSGTTIGEAHKLGFTSYGQDINAVAVEAVRVALSKIDRKSLIKTFNNLDNSIGSLIRDFYKTKDSEGRVADVLYFFWVMQTDCTHCSEAVDLFPSWIMSKNAYPNKKPEIKILCPQCGSIFPELYTSENVTCNNCAHSFSPKEGNAKRGSAICNHCKKTFSISKSRKESGTRPKYRQYGKLILNVDGGKEYLPVSNDDLAIYKTVSKKLKSELKKSKILLPQGSLEEGYNTNQAIKYGFHEWKDFFNDRQLLVLSLLQLEISQVKDLQIRDALLVLFSGLLEFNNLFASYKGEGTGAVRHMFSHHILKPEKLPIEANIWGTNKSSGSFSGLFKSRLLRAIDYKENPIEVGSEVDPSMQKRESFSDNIVMGFKNGTKPKDGSIYLACGDSAGSGLADKSIDLVITDPPFFDNVHYSELADFFYAWQKLIPRGFIKEGSTTRAEGEVQDANADDFAKKLGNVFKECHRVLKDDGLLVFSYHHSREEGWRSVAEAILQGGFSVVNAHPVKAEMSGSTPISQSNDPIQLDTLIVCKKAAFANSVIIQPQDVLDIAYTKIERLKENGFKLSRGDEKTVLYGQALTLLKKPDQENVSIVFPELITMLYK
jgi:putative DNA methylase